MSTDLILATRNEDKITEIKSILSNTDINVLTLNEFPDAPDAVENGFTLEENAIKKAKIIAGYTGIAALADDTGLEVDYLNGEPGVYSSRYSGDDASYFDNVNKLLKELKGVPWEKRSARFRCVLALYKNRNQVKIVEGICKGLICEEPRGDKGFGYDPVFFVPEYNCTFAEMETNLKNQVSHRAKAFSNFKYLLQRDELNLES